MSRIYGQRTIGRFNRHSEPAKKEMCRKSRCKGKGYNRYCLKHTPRKGVGLLRCNFCSKPYADHEMSVSCQPVRSTNQGGTR